MTYIIRNIEEEIKNGLKRGKSILLLGPRQTGKTTLLNRIKSDLTITFLISKDRLRFEKDPDQLIGIVDAMDAKKPLIILDEIQLAPQLMDTVQYLVDENKAQFVLTGSSARKLRRQSNINLLPGRVLNFRMDPLSLSEFKKIPSLDTLLLNGSLPGIITTPSPSDQEDDLDAYVSIYLDEEIRGEAAVRNIQVFAQFIELFGIESGNITNFSKLSRDLGVSHNTVKSYYEILEDCLIAEPVYPVTKSQTRKKLLKSPIYLFFDLGIRRLAAKEGTRLPREKMGQLFEQFVGLECLRAVRKMGSGTRLKFWRDADGPEVDWVIKTEDHYIPIEVKYTETPTQKDAKHVETFMTEYPSNKGFVVCRAPYDIQLTPQIKAISWKNLLTIFDAGHK